MRESWSILPASCLFDKTKVTIGEIAREWSDGTVIVCEKSNGSIGFIAGSAGDYGVKVGDRVGCRHDQTFANLGTWVIKNILSYKTVDGQVVIESPVEFDRKTKATIAVFK